MSRLRATEPITVRIGECECPSAPHEQDEAFLRPRMRVEDAVEAMIVMRNESSDEEMHRALTSIFLRGLESWNLLDDDGKPIPVSEVTGGRLGWETTKPIVDAAFDTYGAELMRPLEDRMRTLSADGPTGPSTSPTLTSSGKRQRR